MLRDVAVIIHELHREWQIAYQKGEKFRANAIHNIITGVELLEQKVLRRAMTDDEVLDQISYAVHGGVNLCLNEDSMFFYARWLKPNR